MNAPVGSRSTTRLLTESRMAIRPSGATATASGPRARPSPGASRPTWPSPLPQGRVTSREPAEGTGRSAEGAAGPGGCRGRWGRRAGPDGAATPVTGPRRRAPSRRGCYRRRSGSEHEPGHEQRAGRHGAQADGRHRTEQRRQAVTPPSAGAPAPAPAWAAASERPPTGRARARRQAAEQAPSRDHVGT